MCFIYSLSFISRSLSLFLDAAMCAFLAILSKYNLFFFLRLSIECEKEENIRILRNSDSKIWVKFLFIFFHAFFTSMLMSSKLSPMIWNYLVFVLVIIRHGWRVLGKTQTKLWIKQTISFLTWPHIMHKLLQLVLFFFILSSFVVWWVFCSFMLLACLFAIVVVIVVVCECYATSLHYYLPIHMSFTYFFSISSYFFLFFCCCCYHCWCIRFFNALFVCR